MGGYQGNKITLIIQNYADPSDKYEFENMII